jgi:YidC/Oxa1 family membrane protein insertase
MQPSDSSQQQNNVILKILPLMIGWFSLNVPSALCVYWFVNNIVTTATTVFIRNSMEMAPVTAGGDSTADSTSSSSDSTIFAPPPMREKPSGFGNSGSSSSSSSVDSDGVKTITSNAIDAEIESSDMNDSGDSSEGESAGAGMASESQSKKVRSISASSQ